MYQSFCVQVRDEATKAGRRPTRESVWSYFVAKCASNLHIVLCMSPSGETLKTRCRNFPGLVNNTSIDWFTAWPKQALQAVVSQFLSEVSCVVHCIHIYTCMYIRALYPSKKICITSFLRIFFPWIQLVQLSCLGGSVGRAPD